MNTFTTPLQVNQVITATPEVLEKVKSKGFYSHNLIIGHTVQYTHDHMFETIFPTYDLDAYVGNQYSLFDRKILGLYQDDKCATFYGTPPKLSATHTISLNELLFWDSELAAGRDVIIQSFEQADTSGISFLYRGAISFKKLREYDKIIKNGKASGKPIFYRESAYKDCLF